MDVELREPSPADGERLARMNYASWRDAYASFLPPNSGRGDRTAVDQQLGDRLRSPEPGSTTLIAVRDGEIVGFATVGPARQNPTAGAPARDRELWSIYVRAAEYGSGLADRLLDAVLPQQAPAELWVFEANDRARRFYARHGFKADGARHVFGPELGNQAEIRLVR